MNKSTQKQLDEILRKLEDLQIRVEVLEVAKTSLYVLPTYPQYPSWTTITVPLVNASDA